MIIGHFFCYHQIATSKSRNHGITFTKCQIVVVTTDDHVKHSHKNKEDEDRKNVKFLHILVTCLTRMRRLSSGLSIRHLYLNVVLTRSSHDIISHIIQLILLHISPHLTLYLQKSNLGLKISKMGFPENFELECFSWTTSYFF